MHELCFFAVSLQKYGTVIFLKKGKNIGSSAQKILAKCSY